MKFIRYQIYAFLFCLLPLISYCQKQDRLSILAGPIVPIGKELKSSYTLGVRLGVDCKILTIQKFRLSSDIAADLFVNNPPSQPNVLDNLFLYSLQLKAAYQPTLFNGWIEPALGVGYMFGHNFLTDKSSDFTGGYFHSKVRLMNLNGFTISGGLMSREINRIKLGLFYRFQRPIANLTDEIKANSPFYYNTTLYGPTITYESQKMNLDNLALLVTIRL